MEQVKNSLCDQYFVGSGLLSNCNVGKTCPVESGIVTICVQWWNSILFMVPWWINISSPKMRWKARILILPRTWDSADPYGRRHLLVFLNRNMNANHYINYVLKAFAVPYPQQLENLIFLVNLKYWWRRPGLLDTPEFLKIHYFIQLNWCI